MVDAVTEPSELAVPLTVTDCPTVRSVTGTDCNSLTWVLESKRTIFVPVVADELVELGSWIVMVPLPVEMIVPVVNPPPAAAPPLKRPAPPDLPAYAAAPAGDMVELFCWVPR